MALNRRECLRSAGLMATGMLGLDRYLAAEEVRPCPRVAPLEPDPQGILDLPDGLTYRIFSRTGQQMDDGLLVPGLHDGMAALPGKDGLTVLIRNHEIDFEKPHLSAFGEGFELLNRVDQRLLYDRGHENRPACGGTTTLVYDTKRQQLQSHFLSLGGTASNCAGGPTPWGTWLSCEETIERTGPRASQDHGYIFQVSKTQCPELSPPIPYRAMGRFRHEAVAVDPRTGIVYETEDVEDGLIYRFLPEKPGNLRLGGQLQALCLRDHSGACLRNWPDDRGPKVSIGQRYATEWIPIENVESPGDDLRYQGHVEKGAAQFARAEGIWWDRGVLYWACTTGGEKQFGQIWRYRPSPTEGQSQEDQSPGEVELLFEPNDKRILQNADNLVVAPWGDLIVCEDSGDRDHLVGITPDGTFYRLARNAMNYSELTGSTFSADGTTLFVNIQDPGMTLAITGNWPSIMS